MEISITSYAGACCFASRTQAAWSKRKTAEANSYLQQQEPTSETSGSIFCAVHRWPSLAPTFQHTQNTWSVYVSWHYGKNIWQKDSPQNEPFILKEKGINLKTWWAVQTVNIETSCIEKVAPVRCVSHNCHIWSGLSSHLENEEVLWSNCAGEAEKLERFSNCPLHGEVNTFGQHLVSVQAIVKYKSLFSLLTTFVFLHKF